MSRSTSFALTLTLSALVFSSFWAQASSVTVPSDIDYQIYQEHDYYFVFDPSYSSWLGEVVGYNRYFSQLYSKEYLWDLDETTALVLTSHRNQVSNAFATVIPNNLTVFFGAGAPVFDDFAIHSWVDTLLAHETAHLYQLNVKPSLSKLLGDVLGNGPVIITPFIVPIFIHPNVLAPTYLTEGNATFNEGRFGNGGRLYSGTYRALVMALIKDRKINFNRLVNNHLEFPMGTEKYLVGGYFNLFLGEQYGTQRVNQFFKFQAEHNINPLILNETYVSTYFKTYDVLLSEFNSRFEGIASQQQSSTQPPIQSSFMHAGFHRENDRIYFLTTKEAKSYPEVNVFDIKTQSLSQKALNLPFGKVFEQNGAFYSVASARVDVENHKYGLFTTGLTPDETSLNKVVFDQRQGRRLYADARNSYQNVELYLDDRHVGSAHSSALMDEQANVFYFKQSGKTRTLYKNQDPVGSYKGYFGKIADVDDEYVYFIGATEPGSTLFAMDGEGKVHRLSPSDVIVDARKIDSESFLVAEVSSTGYLYKLIPMQIANDAPYEYTYYYETEPEFTQSKELGASSELKHNDFPAYHSLTSLRFSTLSPALLYSQYNGRILALEALFTDPMMYNNVSFAYAFAENGDQDGIISYSNERYRLGWFLGYGWTRLEGPLEPTSDTQIFEDSDSNKVFAGLKYPLFRWRQWSSTWVFQSSWENNLSADQRSDEYGVTNAFNLNRTIGYLRSYEAYRLFSLWGFHKLSTQAPQWSGPAHSYGAQVSVGGDFGYENFVNLTLTSGRSETDNLVIRSLARQEISSDTLASEINQKLVTRLSEHHGATLTYKKVVNSSVYFPRFPVSLRRFAPVIGLTSKWDVHSGGSKAQMTQALFGLEAELLLLHKAPSKFNLIFTEPIGNSGSGILASFRLRQDF